MTHEYKQEQKFHKMILGNSHSGNIYLVIGFTVSLSTSLVNTKHHITYGAIIETLIVYYLIFVLKSNTLLRYEKVDRKV